MNRTRTIAVVGGTAALLGAGALALRGGPVEEPAAGPATVTVAELRDLEVLAEASGTVEPVRTVEVKSKASGEVLAIHVETGDRVAAGTLLAEIDPRDVQSALDQAAADLESARVRLATTDAQRGRMEELRGSGVVTQQEYEAAVEAAASARATLVRAETSLRLARERREDVTIRAPIAGTVIARTVEPGQIIASATSNVSGGSTLFTMADLSQIQVRAKVDETDVGRVRPGQAAEVTVEAYPGRTFRGEVVKIEPQAVVEQNVTMFPVLVRIPNPDDLLRPGMNAEVSVRVARRAGAVAVPNAAVVGVRDARAAAATLGLDEEAVGAAMRPRRSAGGAGGVSGDGSAAVPGGTGSGTEVSAGCAGLRERVREAGGPAGLDDGTRARLRECFAQRGGGMRGGAGADAPSGDAGTRPGFVFVETEDGPEPRRVTLGLSDWEHTEVVDGLEAGERVVLVSVAQLQRQQQEMNDRFRRRAGGMMPGGG